MMHPLELFNYCPKCGSPRFEVNNEKSKRCADCGFVYYFNSSAATVAFILNDKNELLVCRRGKEPAKGTLDLSGGFIDCMRPVRKVWRVRCWKKPACKWSRLSISSHSLIRIFIRDSWYIRWTSSFCVK